MPPLGRSSGSDQEPCAEELEAHATWKEKLKRRNDEATIQPASSSMPPLWWEGTAGAEKPRFPNMEEKRD